MGAYGNDVHAFVRGLEQVVIATLGATGISAQTIKGLTGVWTTGEAPPTGSHGRARKIASIGLHVSRGVTTHGLAINVNNDLQPFEWIVPCGIEEVTVTSVARELEHDEDLNRLGEALVTAFAHIFGTVPVRAYGGMARP